MLNCLLPPFLQILDHYLKGPSLYIYLHQSLPKHLFNTFPCLLGADIKFIELISWLLECPDQLECWILIPLLTKHSSRHLIHAQSSSVIKY
jgi:hypothetical protein